MSDADLERKQEKTRELLGRLKVIKIHDLDRLILLLAKIISQIKKKQLNFNLKMIIIDSLSSLFWESGSKSQKQHDRYQQLIKEVLYYFKILTRRYFISVIFTNNSREGGATRVTELQN
jgi:hypothetical protein